VRAVAQRSPLLPIFLIVLVDVLGFTIVIPLLAFYAEKFGASPLVATTLVSVYAVCSLISTPIIGNMSDRYGRRRLLLISQAGTCLGFLMLAYSSSLWMVFVGRILDGITAGNLSLAQAYISDHTEPKDRAKAFGVIGVAFGVGFSFGPGLGGVLSKAYGPHAPFILAAGLSALSMIATATLLQKDGNPGASAAPVGPGGKRPGAFDIATYTEYFRRPGLGTLYLQFFLFSFAFSCFMSNFALFSERRFTIEHKLSAITEKACHLRADDKLELPGAKRGTLVIDGTPLVYDKEWVIVDESTIELRGNACMRAAAPGAKLAGSFPWSAHEVGLLFVFSGVIGIIMQGGILGRLVRTFGEMKLVIAGFVTAAIGYALLGFTHSLWLLLVCATFNAFGNGVLRPSLTSQITQVAGRREQGIAIGISSSLSSLAMMMAPPTGGALLDHNWLLAWAMVPATVAVLGLFATLAGRSKVEAAIATPADPKGAAKGDELSSPP